MASDSFIFYSLKILTSLVKEIIFFPLWWYTRGLKNLIFWLENFLADKQKSLALFVWIKNIFKPMYAQSDWQGKIISFFMRLVQIIFRGLVMVFWLFFCLAIFIFWLILPVLTLYQIAFQLLY